MLTVLPYHGGDILEIALAALFTLLFTWIAIGFWFAIYGFPAPYRRRPSVVVAATPRSPSSSADGPHGRRYAIYQEPIERTLGGLRAVYLS